jgi:uracil-DNA glycosylase family 4
MEGRRRVLGPLNGRIPAEVMFVGEAPGRFGADIDGIPFHGDRAGRNFERLLRSTGLDRGGVFITNAVICNPRSPTGANSRPTALEIRNCASWLERTINLVDPKLVVSLGGVSLEALDRLATHGLKLSRDIGKTVQWFDRLLLPLYHPGGRAMARRPFPQQERDWASVVSALSGLCDEMAAQLLV